MPARLVAAVLASVLLAAAAGGCGSGGDAPGEDEPRRVELVLDFVPNAVHAGVYAAAAEGEDRDRGVELEIRTPSASTDSLRLLTGERADVAIVDIHDLGLARERGEDVVGVGAIVQRPLAAVLAEPAIERPRQLEGERVGVTGLPSDDAVLRAVVESDGGSPNRIEKVTIGFSAVRDLVAGNVDAATAFWNAEGVALRERGFAVNDFRVDDYGAPGYPELLLTVRRETLEADPELVQAVLSAVAAGTEAALADRDASVARIAEVSSAEEGLVRAQLDAVAPALTPPVRLDRGALERWARFDVRFGILQELPDVGRAFSFDVGRDLPG